MEIRENPNYYIQERPYKSKYICCNCRKAFKRKVANDIKGLTEDAKPAKCPDCGNETYWIGPKFRPPKSTDIKKWNSIEVMMKIGLLNFIGWSNNNIPIPEGKKSLNDLLISLRDDYQINIRKWLSADYSEENSKQIKLFSEIIKRIEKEITSF